MEVVQKYTKGDLVRVAKDLGSSMSHFQGDCDAVVVGSYADQYGGNNTTSYTLRLKGRGTVSWYEEWQLALIEKGRNDLLQSWEDEEKTNDAQKMDLDWIFSHGAEVLERRYGRSIEALAACFGLNNLWGPRGEGIVYYANAMATIHVAAPYLLKGDKSAWLEDCKAAMSKRTASPQCPR